MPDLEGAEEITVGAWSKKKGDHVDEGETLLEALTDKVNAEIPSPVAGTVGERDHERRDIFGHRLVLLPELVAGVGQRKVPWDGSRHRGENEPEVADLRNPGWKRNVGPHDREQPSDEDRPQPETLEETIRQPEMPATQAQPAPQSAQHDALAKTAGQPERDQRACQV